MLIVSQWLLISNMWPPSSGLNANNTFVFPIRSQMLQLWRAKSSCQRMPATTSAQKVPFLPKHRPHGGQLSNQSTAVVTRISGKIHNLNWRRWRHEPHPLTSRDLWLVIRETRAPIKTCQAAFGTNSGFSFSNSRNECQSD